MPQDVNVDRRVSKVHFEHMATSPDLTVVRHAVVARPALDRRREGEISPESLVCFAYERAEIGLDPTVGPDADILHTSVEEWAAPCET